MKPINSKPVYLYDLKGNLLLEFESTNDCAKYFEKDCEYINHNLKYCKKIRKNGKWFIISRRKEQKGNENS